MSDRYDVLVAGEHYCDVIFSGLDATPDYGREVVATGLNVHPGGNYNVALGLVRLGLRTAWSTDFGTDLFSRIVLEQAEADGIDPVAFRHLGRPAAMVTAAFADTRERGFITYRGAPIVPPATELLARIQPRWLLQSFRYTPDWLDFMRSAKVSGAGVFGDCSHDAATLATPGVRDFISLCDVFSLNEAEALRLTGAASVDTALSALGALASAVLIKRGPDGVRALIDGVHYEETAPQVEVVDTVGAGDAFSAGYLAGAFWNLDIAHRLRTAVACGTLSTTGPGSSASPTAAEVRAFIAASYGP